MVTIHLPPQISALAPMECLPGARGVLTDFRACAQAVDNVVDQLGPHSLPDGWEGATAQSAGAAMASYTKRADGALAALERANLALDRYLDAIDLRHKEWTNLVDRRTSFNTDLDNLTSRIPGATADQVAALDQEAAGLRQRHDTFGQDLFGWQQRVALDEDTLIAAFGTVDSTSEGQSARKDPSRPDTIALLAALHRIGNDPAGVNAWWRSLTPAQREALIDSDPDVVGNTNGIPTGDRDEANRGAMENDFAFLNNIAPDQRTDAQQHELDRITNTRNAVHLGEVHLPPVDTNLIVYQPHAFGGDGAAAVTYGDPDTADNTAILVPGLTSDMSSIDSLGHDALNVYDQSAQGGHSDAVIAWMGYDAPNFSPQNAGDLPSAIGDVASVSDEGKAEQGGHLLSDFVNGLHATHHADVPSHITVIGHSYGSTTAAHAAADGMKADDLVLVGSPGAGGGVHNVAELNMSGGHVFVGAKPNDFVTWLGGEIPINVLGHHYGNLGMGEDPSQASFGATNFDVVGGYPDPAQHTGYDATLDNEPFHANQVSTIGVHNHNSYFASGTDSLTNIGHIVNGEPPQNIGDVGGGPRHDPAHHSLYQWAGHEAAYQVMQELEHRWPHLP